MTRQGKRKKKRLVFISDSALFTNNYKADRLKQLQRNATKIQKEMLINNQ